MKRVILQQLTSMSKYGVLGMLLQCMLYTTIFAENTYAQRSIEDVIISIDLADKNLEQVFSEIESKTAFYFSYRRRIVENMHVPEAHLKDTSLADVLRFIARQTGLSFKRIDENIFVKLNDPLQVAPVEEVLDANRAMDITVSGIVKASEDNTPLPGVNILVKGTTIGTTTDAGGRYSLTVPENSILLFSYIGYQSQEISVGAQSVLNVVMETDIGKLEEVVVIGYGTQKREEITSAISSIKAEEFNDGVITSPLQLIYGQVPGFVMTSGSDPNGYPSFQIRGIGSIDAITGPLYVIDGIPGGDMNAVSPADIESIEILKDGSASAIYGSRATFGVIIVNTKRGKAGAPLVSYKTYVSTDRIARKLDMLSANEYRDLLAQKNITGLDFGASTNWFDQITQNPISYSHNLSVSGGSDKTTYRASITYQDFEGVDIRTDRRFVNTRFNMIHKAIGGKLVIEPNLGVSFEKRQSTSTGAFQIASELNPTFPVFNPDGSYYEPNNLYNPVADLRNSEDFGNDVRFLGSLRTTLEVLPGLKLGGFYAREHRMGDNYEYEFSWSRESIEDDRKGFAERSYDNEKVNTYEATLEYMRSFGAHNFNIIGGYSYQDILENEFEASNANFLTDAYKWENLGAGSWATDPDFLDEVGVDSEAEGSKLIAFFGRLIYDYNGKYMFTAALRREGSSKFGPNHEWGLFPAVTGGWRITDEQFMSGQSIFEDLKLRVGYGITGNQGLDPYQTIFRMENAEQYLFNGQWITTYGPEDNVNPDVRWEKKHELNLGTDFTLANGKLSGSIDYYTRTTKDLLLEYQAQVPSNLFDETLANAGEIQNRGLELLLTAPLLNRGALKWSSTFNVGYNRNKVVSLSEGVYQQSSFFDESSLPSSLGTSKRVQEGYPLESFYGRVFEGFTSDGGWIFKDLNDDGIIDNNDRTFIGRGTPLYHIGFTNRLRYNNFDLTVFLRGSFDFQILNQKEMFYGNLINFPGRNVLKSAVNSTITSRQYSDYYLEDGDYATIQNITLGYGFPTQNIKYLRQARIYATAVGLHTFTGYSGLDPSQTLSGSDGLSFYPRTKSFMLGLEITFE